MLESVDSIAMRLSATNISDSSYGKNTRRLIRLVTDMRAMGFV